MSSHEAVVERVAQAVVQKMKPWGAKAQVSRRLGIRHEVITTFERPRAARDFEHTMRMAVAVGIHPLTALAAAYVAPSHTQMMALVELSHVELKLCGLDQTLRPVHLENLAANGDMVFARTDLPSLDEVRRVAALVCDFIAYHADEAGGPGTLAAKVGLYPKSVRRYRSVVTSRKQVRSFPQILQVIEALGFAPLTVIAAAFHADNYHLLGALTDGEVQLVRNNTLAVSPNVPNARQAWPLQLSA